MYKLLYKLSLFEWITHNRQLETCPQYERVSNSRKKWRYEYILPEGNGKSQWKENSLTRGGGLSSAFIDRMHQRDLKAISCPLGNAGPDTSVYQFKASFICLKMHSITVLTNAWTWLSLGLMPLQLIDVLYPSVALLFLFSLALTHSLTNFL